MKFLSSLFTLFVVLYTGPLNSKDNSTLIKNRYQTFFRKKKIEYVKTTYKINNKKFLILFSYKKKKPTINTKSKSKSYQIINKLVGITFSNGKILEYIRINNGKVISNFNRTIIDLSTKRYSYLGFYGWYVTLPKETKHNIPALALDPSTHGGKGTTDGFHLFYSSRYNQFVYAEYMPPQRIIIDSTEPEIINIARAGFTEGPAPKTELIEYIKKLTPSKRRLLRNSLFALHGYKFKNPKLLKYFSQFFWYKPKDNIPNNITILTKEQKELHKIIVNLK